MAIKHKSWRLQEIAAENRRRDSLDQKSRAELNKIKAGNELEKQREWRRKQQFKTDRENAKKRAVDINQANMTTERDLKIKEAQYYKEKKVANMSVSKQESLRTAPTPPVRGQKLRPQPQPKLRARKQSIEERQALGRKHVNDLGVYSKH